MRERVVALTAHYAIQDEPQTFLPGVAAPAAVTSDRVDAFLRTYYPLYDRGDDFALAHARLPPADAATCSGDRKTAAVVVVPGVIRATERREFEGQIRAVATALPCLDFRRVDFGSFDDPDARIVPEVKKVVDAIDREDGPVPLHLVGYSQGVVVTMRTLAQDPAIGRRTRSVLAMNGASHGSEAADFAIQLMDGIGRCQPWQLLCKSMRSHAFKILTESLFHVSLSADEGSDRFEEVMERKRAGMRSLTTSYANTFWSGPAAAIPRHAPDALFFTFRSTITNTDPDPERGNLPDEQVASFNLVWDRATNPASPFNDMQVRLENQTLGGPVAPREVTSRVAEGNHWQWQLTATETGNHMEEEMIRRSPRNALFHAYYRALAEIGLAGGS
jgi:hypothetical protein